jgi:hypothetical protein
MSIPEIQEPDNYDGDADAPINPTSDHTPNLDQHSKPNQFEPNLARLLELLVRKVGSLSGASKSKSLIKPHTPDVFDGMDPSKLKTFIFQCSMYMMA